MVGASLQFETHDMFYNRRNNNNNAFKFTETYHATQEKVVPKSIPMIGSAAAIFALFVRRILQQQLYNNCESGRAMTRGRREREKMDG